MNDPAPFEQPSFMVTLYFEIFYHTICRERRKKQTASTRRTRGEPSLFDRRGDGDSLESSVCKDKIFAGGRPMVAPTGLCENYHSRVTLSGAETFKERSYERSLVGRGIAPAVLIQ